MLSYQALYCTNEKGKCEKRFHFAITDPTLVNASTTVREKHGRDGNIGDNKTKTKKKNKKQRKQKKRKKKAHVCIKRG